MKIAQNRKSIRMIWPLYAVYWNPFYYCFYIPCFTIAIIVFITDDRPPWETYNIKHGFQDWVQAFKNLTWY